MKLKTLTIAMVIMACLLSACGSTSSTDSAGSTASGTDGGTASEQSGSGSESAEKKKLDFMWFSDGVEGEVTQSIIDEYEAVNPNIEINLIEVPYNDYENQLKIAISGGEPPALARVTYVGLFKDASITFDDYVDAESFKAQFSDSLDPFYIYDGKIKGVPIDTTANGLIYNKTAFEKAGVEVPANPGDIWTIDEWIDAMKRVMESGDVRYGLVIDKTPHRFSTLLYGQGGRILSEDLQTTEINSEAGIRTVDIMKRLHDENICPASVWVGSENPNDMFRTGQVAMHLAGSWMMTNYRDNITDFEWGVTYLPVGVTRSSVPGGKYVIALDNTSVEQEAVDFIEYYISKEVNQKYCSESLFLSPRNDLADMEFSFGSESWQIFANELANSSPDAARDWGYAQTSALIKEPLLDGVAEVIQGKTSSKDMLDSLAEKVNAELAEINS